MKSIYKSLTFTGIVFITLFLSSCKKEYALYPYNEILGFTIQDTAGTDLKASIVNKDIIIYWPPYQKQPDSISPNIIISKNASISPASASKIAFLNNTIYTVTAEDGSINTYQLKINLNQPKPILESVSGGAGSVGSSIAILGDFFIEDLNQTSVFLINNKNEEIPVTKFNSNSINQLRINTYFPDLPVGSKYVVKVINGKHIMKSTDSLTISAYKTNPTLITDDGLFPKTLKRGEEYTYSPNGTPASGIITCKLRLLSNNSFHSVDIVSRTAQNEIKIKIPQDMPLGTYSGMQITSNFLTSAYTISIASSRYLTITE